MLRRTFLQGCTAALALTALQPRLVLGAPRMNGEVLVVLSLRGGWDSLSAFVPHEDKLYYESRPNLAVAKTLELDGPFRIHPAMRSLRDLYRAGNLAIIPAAGLWQDTRSHFQATAWMDGGIPGRSAPTGWLARYLARMQLEPGGFPAVALGVPSQALQGFPRTVGMDDLDELDFTLPREDLADSLMDDASRNALQALRTAREVAERAECGEVEYPDTDLGWELSQAARLIRCQDLGVRVVTLELDGFDTHSWQNDTLPDLLTDVSDSLAAFAEDLDGLRVTTVVMSEFGRTLAENSSQGTDHGRASAMLVMGQGIRGGIYGRWPELAEVTEVTVDYRSVLGEVLGKRFGCASLGEIFPGCTEFQALGLTELDRPLRAPLAAGS